MDEPNPSRRWLDTTRRVLGVLACIVAAVYVMALARRPITGVDLGYHLAYGQHFLQTGDIVDDDRFIAPPVTRESVGDLPLAPGAGFDADGRYRFPNANWGTQVILAWLWNRGSWTALCGALFVLVLLIAAAQACILRRLTIPLVWLGPVWLTFGIVAHERFLLRPELFAFACLAWQLWLLCGRVTWGRVVAFALVQLLAVNLHSYWLLGAAMALAFAADAVARAAWGRWITRSGPMDVDLRRRLVRLMICAAAMLPAAMAHPAGPANAAYPFRTLSYLRAHEIPGRTKAEIKQLWADGTLHPWQTIGEFQTPFPPGAWERPSTWALAALLGLGAAAIAVLAIRRQWAFAVVIAAMSLSALSMRRNMIIPAILATPLIALAAHGVRVWCRDKWGARPSRPLIAIGCYLVLITVGGWWIFGVVTNRVYIAQRRSLYFGWGYSALTQPVGPCRWLDEYLPQAGPAFVDQNTSSGAVFFSRRVTGAPTLTNTWATPPQRMKESLEIGAGRRPIAALDDWGYDVAVVQGQGINRALIRRLEASDDWALVRAELSWLIFLRRTEAHAPVIEAHEISFERFDASAFIVACRQAHPVGALPLRDGAKMLQEMGWFAQSDDVWDACLADPVGSKFHESWVYKGRGLAIHGVTRLSAGDTAGADDLREARRCFQQALELEPGFQPARKSLRQLGNDAYRLRVRW